MAEKQSVFSLIQNSSYRQLQLILESDDNINCRNERQETPLMSAMISLHDHVKRANVVRMLIDLGADVNVQNMRGQTPFMYACILNQPDTLSTLLHCETINGNMQDLDGNTGLMYACALGNVAVVQVVAQGIREKSVKIDLHMTNREGATAFLFAKDSGHEDIIRLLILAGAPDSFHNSQEHDLHSTHESTQNTLQEKEQGRSSRDMMKCVTESVNFVTRNNAELKDTNTVKENERIPERETSQRSSGEEKLSDDTLENSTKTDTTVPAQKEEAFEKLMAARAKKFKAMKSKQTERLALALHSEINGTTISNNQSKPLYRPTAPKTPDPSSSGTGAVIDVSKAVKKGFGDEYAVYDKIYSTTEILSPVKDNNETAGNPPFVNESILAGSSDIFSGILKTYDQIKTRRENSTDVKIGTGKLNFFSLPPRHRARILSRSIWSVYGEPLPPIPLDVDTMERVIEGISDIRKYLRKSKCQAGRLINLDPDLWCIVESIRCQMSLTK